MNKELLVLIYALCGYNFLTVPINITNGIARMLDDYPMGEFGCFLSIPFACAVINATSLTLALISYERRQILTSFEDPSKSGSGLRKIILCLVLINCFSFTTYPLIFYKMFEMITIVKYPIYGTNKPLVNVCVPQNDKYGLPLEVVFTFLNFLIPLSITCFNYCSIWKYNRRLFVQTETCKRAYQTNAFFARLMIASVVEFVICQLPFDIAMFIAFLLRQRNGDLHLNSTSIFVSFIFAFTDCVINPLWFSFISLKKTNNGTLSKVSLRLITVKKYRHSQLSTLSDYETGK